MIKRCEMLSVTIFDIFIRVYVTKTKKMFFCSFYGKQIEIALDISKVAQANNNN